MGLEQQPPTRREPLAQDAQQAERILDPMQEAEAEDQIEPFGEAADVEGVDSQVLDV